MHMSRLLSALLVNSIMVLPAVAQDASGGYTDQTITDTHYRPGRLEHIVLFKFKPDITSDAKRLIVERFLGLKDSALRQGKPYIVSIVSGSQNSLEGLGKGYEQGFIVTFNSEGDRNYYVGRPAVNDPKYFDPAHEAFKHFVRPYLSESDDGVLVFDFSVGH